MLRRARIPYVSDRMTAVNDCSFVVSSCATSADVEELYLGDGGLLEVLSEGVCCIDASFSSPRLACEIQAMAAVGDIYAVDAPVTALGEKEGSIAFVGGDEAGRGQAAPLLPFLAEKLSPQKSPGEGQMAALVAYIGLAGSLMGTIEAVSLAHIAGFPESSSIDALASTSAGSRALVDYAPKMILHDYEGKISVHGLLDALDVVLDLTEELDVTAPLVETVYQLYDLLATVGGDDLNIQALALLYEDEQTCAKFGLDWALADEEYGGYDDEGDEGDFDLEEFLRSQFGGRRCGSGPRPSAGGFFSEN